MFEASGIKLFLYLLVAGWLIPSSGPWVALATISIPWMCMTILRDRRPSWSLVLSLALPATSPSFWKALATADAGAWGFYAWLAALILGMLASIAVRLVPPAPPHSAQ